MSQDLVPDDLPYGERQKRVAQMQAADVPLESSGQSGTPQLLTPVPSGGGVPADLDALTAVQPSSPGDLPPMMSEAERLRMLADQTPNTVLSIVLRRISESL